jgi:anti-sigma B factor antagonist
MRNSAPQARPAETASGYRHEALLYSGMARRAVAAGRWPGMTAQRAGGAVMTATQLELACEITAAGEALVSLSGELDTTSADGAFGCVRDVIDRHHLPVILDMAGLTFCDARGLGALVRMSNYAGKAGCPFQLASPGPRLLQIMRITGLDRSLAIRVPQPAPPRPAQPALAVP